MTRRNTHRFQSTRTALLMGLVSAALGVTGISHAAPAPGQPVRKIVVEVVDVSRKRVVNGKLETFFVGPGINRKAAQWTLPLRHWGGLSAVERASRLLSMSKTEIADGIATVSIPDGAESVWIEVHHATDNTGSPSMLGGVVAGPYPLTGTALRIIIPPGRSVSGRVALPSGLAADRVSIAVTPVRPHVTKILAYAHRPHHSIAVLDAAGAFEARGLGLSEYALDVVVPHGFAPPNPVRIRASSQDINLKEPLSVSRGVDLVIALRDAHGVALKSVPVRARAGIWRPAFDGVRRFEGTEDPYVPFWMSNENGEVRVSGLMPGAKYRIIALDKSKKSAFEQELEGTVEIPTRSTKKVLGVELRPRPWTPDFVILPKPR